MNELRQDLRERLEHYTNIFKARGVKDIKFCTGPEKYSANDLAEDMIAVFEAILNKRYTEISGIGDSVRNESIA